MSNSKLRHFVTAPYLQLYSKGDQKLLKSVAPGGQKISIRWNSDISKILSFFEKAQTIESANQEFSDERITTAILDLVKIQVLLPVNDVKLPLPTLEVELTNLCNAKCSMCPREKIPGFGNMSEATFQKLTEFVKSFPCEGIIIQGIGEPSIYPNLIEPDLPPKN